MQYNIRYDLRNPPQWRIPFDEYYARFLDQVAWADEHGFARVILSEHHFVEDGYVPSIFPVAAAIAARTSRIRINLSLVLLPLKHPIQVAEDAAIVDIISGGRLELTVGGGYRRNEFEGYGIPREERASRMEEGTEIIRRCWEEEEFSFQGRHWQLKNVRMMPKPVQKPRLPLIMGGNSAAAARRAARLADAFSPAQPRWMADYRSELEKLGKDPGPPLPENAPTSPLFLHVARDPDAAWQRIAPHALYEMNEYGKYAVDDPNLPYEPVSGSDALRSDAAYSILTPDEAVAFGKRLQEAMGPAAGLGFHPLMGGMPLELGQESLDLVVSEVMPRLRN